MVVDSLKQGYSNINLKGPLTKFPFSPRSGKVMVKFQIENSNKKKAIPRTLELYTKNNMVGL